MSPPARKHGPCWRKRRYGTEEHAKSVKLHRERKGAEYLRIYRCGRCRGWHLTSQPPRS